MHTAGKHRPDGTHESEVCGFNGNGFRVSLVTTIIVPILLKCTCVEGFSSAFCVFSIPALKALETIRGAGGIFRFGLKIALIMLSALLATFGGSWNSRVEVTQQTPMAVRSSVIIGRCRQIGRCRWGSLRVGVRRHLYFAKLRAVEGHDCPHAWGRAWESHSDPDPLLGGGKAVRALAVAERLMRQMTTMLEQMQQIQQHLVSGSEFSHKGKSRQGRKAKQRAKRRVAGSSATSPHHASHGPPNKSSTNHQQTPLQRNQQQPSESQQKQQQQKKQQQQTAAQDNTSHTWADMLKQVGTHERATAPIPPKKLWPGAWEVSPVTLQGPAEEQKKPAVVELKSHEEIQELRDWHAASGSNQPIQAYVIGEGPCQVLVAGRLWPQVADATSVTLGPSDALPRPKASVAVKDGPRADRPTDILRVTVVKAYCDEQIWASVHLAPSLIPAKVLGSEAKHVMRTMAACSYSEESTCLIVVRKDVSTAALHWSVPVGAFVSPHKQSEAGRKPVTWMLRQAGDTDADYFHKVKKIADKEKAALAFRPGGRANLGIRGLAKQTEGMQHPRWAISHCPKGWLDADAMQWAKSCGFSEITHLQQMNKDTWIMRAWPPQGQLQLVMIAESGIVVGPAAAPRRKQAEQPTSKQSAWGAPSEPLHSAGYPPLPVSPPTPVVNGPDHGAEDHPRKRPKAEESDPTKGNKEEPDVEMGGANAAPPEQQGKQSNTSTAEVLPWAGRFEVVECGGQGDCAYTSIAAGLAHHSNHSKQPSSADLQPRGKLQAYLRSCSAKELRGHPEHYYSFVDAHDVERFAAKVATAGEWADSLSLTALANAVSVELVIFAWESKLELWRQYEIKPRQGKIKQRVYLTLREHHYQWLKPVTQQAIQDQQMQPVKPQLLKLNVSCLLRGGGEGEEEVQESECASMLGLSLATSGTSDVASGSASAKRRRLNSKQSVAQSLRAAGVQAARSGGESVGQSADQNGQTSLRLGHHRSSQ